MNSYKSRMSRLEVRAGVGAKAQLLSRFIIEFVNVQREAVTLLANGQLFQRADGESEDEFRQRARQAVS